MGVQRHREPGHAQPEIPRRRRDEESAVLHGPLSGGAVRRRRAFRRMAVRTIVALLAAGFVTAAHGAACIARSGAYTTALVELYTSEGCSSCPPADRWLSTLGERRALEQVVPLALHVDYWDYIGWKDPYAKREFSQRQRRLSQLQRASFVYTPQVLVQGRDFPAWGSAEFDRVLTRINAQPARASLELEIVGLGADRLRLRVRSSVADAAAASRAVVYVASFE